MHPTITRARHRVSDAFDQVTGALAVRLLTRVLDGQRGHSDQFRVLNAALADVRTSLHRRFDHMENLMTATRDEFSSDLAELGSAIGDLSTRIEQLPDSVDKLTQADLDSIKGLTGRVNSLAVASPQVPTEPSTPTEETPTGGEPTPAPVEDAPVEQSGDARL